MPELISFENKMNSVYVDSSGEVGLDEVLESIRIVAELLKKHDSNRLIVDVRKQEVALPLVDTFTICKDLTSTLPKSLKIAYIVLDPPKQSHSFFTLMANCFGCPVEAFYSVETAMTWLDGDYNPKTNPFLGKVKFPSVS